MALANASDEEIGEAIVVVVTDGDAHAVEFHVEAGNFGDVGEGAVAVVAVELERGALALVPGPIHGIDKEDVGPAVGVVIEKGATRAESFGEEFAAVGPTVVVKRNAGLRGDIRELKAKGVGGWRGKRKSCRKGARAERVFQEVTPLHGRFTRPLRIA